MNRGARRDPVFTSASEARMFLGVLGEQLERSGAEVHAYCLMPNHFHLLVRSTGAGVSDLVQHLVSTYTRRFNLRHGWDGPLFRGRFRSHLVDTDQYLSAVSRYIHRNPIGLPSASPLDRFRWSSYGGYVGTLAAPGWLTTEVLSGFHGGADQIRRNVEGPPVAVSPAELRQLLSMAVSERHPDPAADTGRFDRTLATAMASHLPAPAADALIAHLGYPTPDALRKGRERGRIHLTDTPELHDILRHVLTIAV
jgi:REP element-mobilizing transposase RayT